MDELIYKKWKPTIEKNGICDNYFVKNMRQCNQNLSEGNITLNMLFV